MVRKRNTVMQERERQALELVDRMSDALEAYTPAATPVPFDGLTFVIATYNIPRHLERTLRCCGAKYQSAPSDQIEIIVVDNGSTPPVPQSIMQSHPDISEIIRVDGKPSPVFGLNEGLRRARFNNVALMIDGAHILSPGVFQRTKEVVGQFSRPVINVPQYMLGETSQTFSTSEFAFEHEEHELDRLGWPADGYSLFNFATRVTELADRPELFDFESNCLISTKAVFDECGAFDERFSEPGAGMANVEMFWRLIHEPLNTYVRLPGEGSFHQDHGGTTTSLTREQRADLLADFHAHNKEVTGVESMYTVRSPFQYGPVFHAATRIPTISMGYGREKSRLLTELSQLHIASAENGETPPQLFLTERKPVLEHAPRPFLPPLGRVADTAAKQGCEPDDIDYRNILGRIHRDHRPKLYLEIGVDNGYSLQLARCESIGIDPAFEVNSTQHFPTSLFRSTSDGFFKNEQLCKNRLSKGIDLAYIDGMHLAEFVVRDFINVEKWSSRDGVIVLDDILPEQIEMADRDRHFNAWCGDIYKLIPILGKYRPDLNVRVVEAYAGPYRKGLAIITNLDPGNTVLDEHFDEISASIADTSLAASSVEEIENNGGIVPVGQLFADGFARTPAPADAVSPSSVISESAAV